MLDYKKTGIRLLGFVVVCAIVLLANVSMDYIMCRTNNPKIND